MGMKIHDPNRVRIDLRDSAEDDTTIVYTVPAGHIFYLEECDLTPWNNEVGVMLAWARNEALETIRGLASLQIMSEAGAYCSDHAIFPSYIELIAGDEICVSSDTAGLEVMLTISGFLVLVTS